MPDSIRNDEKAQPPIWRRRYPGGMPFAIRLRWFVVGWVETQLQSMITRRILAYHDSLMERGFIPDLRPPYPGRSSADCAFLQGQSSRLADSQGPAVDGRKEHIPDTVT